MAKRWLENYTMLVALPCAAAWSDPSGRFGESNGACSTDLDLQLPINQMTTVNSDVSCGEPPVAPSAATANGVKTDLAIGRRRPFNQRGMARSAPPPTASVAIVIYKDGSAVHV
jgi:hypothetical protein